MAIRATGVHNVVSVILLNPHSGIQAYEQDEVIVKAPLGTVMNNNHWL